MLLAGLILILYLLKSCHIKNYMSACVYREKLNNDHYCLSLPDIIVCLTYVHTAGKIHLMDFCSLFVTTPSSLMMLGWSNWPMMDASRKKSRLCRSTYPPFSVFMATAISFFAGVLRRPLHTSPNSPVKSTFSQSSISMQRNSPPGGSVVVPI